MNELNIAEILQNAPKDIELRLYSPLIGECVFEKTIKDSNKIRVYAMNGASFTFNSNGTYFDSIGECLLFPSKEKTWENWQKHLFAEGCFIKDEKFGGVYLYLGGMSIQDSIGCTHSKVNLCCYRFADNAEISSFLSKVYDNGCKYKAKEKRIERWMQFSENDTIRLSISSEQESEKQLMHYELTKEQFDVVKVVLDYITKKIKL